MTWAEPRSKRDRLKLYPLGGLGEIGLNMMVLECRDRILIIDAGVMFPEDEMFGVDLVIPDATSLLDQAHKIEAVVITHGHEDHIGALPFLLPSLGGPPVYGSSFSLALIREKLAEHKLSADLNPVRAGERLGLGPFTVRFIQVAHSIPEGFGLEIDTPLGKIVHSGDFKVDHGLGPEEATDLAGFARAGEEEVLLLMADSTNVEREGHTLPEDQVYRSFERIFRECRGRILVACFASNIRRVREVVELAGRFGRKVAFTGKSLLTNVRISRELGLLSLAEDQEVGFNELQGLPPEKICIISTGSQGEPLAALTRIARGEHKQVQVEEGDLVVLSSRFIPGHEKAITRVINNLFRRGAEVLYERLAPIHSSGHAYQEELKLLLNLVKPRYYLPVHGEIRHLVRNGRLAGKLGIPAKRVLRIENGQVVVFDQQGARLEERVESGRVLVDGKGVGDVGEVVIRDRRHLSSEGVVIVLIVADNQTGEIISGPELLSRGFVFEDEREDLLAEAKELVVQALAELEEPDWTEAQERIRRTLRRHFRRSLDRYPMIMSMILPM